MSAFTPWSEPHFKQDITPKAIEKAERVKARQSADEKGSAEAKARGGGRCEMVIGGTRCTRRALHIHHLLGGFGVRGRGASALAKNKLHLCERDHRDIHAHVLVQTGSGTWKRLK